MLLRRLVVVMGWATVLVGLGSLVGLESLSTTAYAQVALNNGDIDKMAKSGMGEAVILSVVQNQPGTYDVTPEALVKLRDDGVTERVLAAMAGKGPAAVLNDYDGLEIGVYYKPRRPAGETAAWVPVPSEAVHAREGGALKSIATNGIIKKDTNGIVDGPKSETVLGAPLEFLVVTPNGVEATDFALVHMIQKQQWREFRTKTGGVFHSSEGVQRDEIKTEQKRVARQTYMVTVTEHLDKGEYGFLAPGLTASSAANTSGKAYTFEIKE